MSTPEDMQLTCFELPHDLMDVRKDMAKSHPVVSITLRNGTADMCSHTLDAERARALFNWLGVWLHTH